MRSQLSQHGFVIGPVKSKNGGRLTGSHGGTAQCIFDLHVAIQEAKTKFPDRPIWLAAYGSGTRIVAMALSGHFALPPRKDGTITMLEIGSPPTSEDGASASVIKKVSALFEEHPALARDAIIKDVSAAILMGFPLDHAKQDRSGALQCLDSTVPVLVLSGAEDNLNKKGMLGAALAESSSASHVVIPGCGCWVFKPKDDSHDPALVHSAINTFKARFVATTAMKED